MKKLFGYIRLKYQTQHSVMDTSTETFFATSPVKAAITLNLASVVVKGYIGLSSTGARNKAAAMLKPVKNLVFLYISSRYHLMFF